MTYEELEAAEQRAYLGPMVNDKGEQYGVIYDASKLTEFEMTMILNGINGERMNRDVWNQVWFENTK